MSNSPVLSRSRKGIEQGCVASCQIFASLQCSCTVLAFCNWASGMHTGGSTDLPRPPGQSEDPVCQQGHRQAQLLLQQGIALCRGQPPPPCRGQLDIAEDGGCTLQSLRLCPSRLQRRSPGSQSAWNSSDRARQVVLMAEGPWSVST